MTDPALLSALKEWIEKHGTSACDIFIAGWRAREWHRENAQPSLERFEQQFNDELALARRILAATSEDFTDEQLTDIGRRARHWVTQAYRQYLEANPDITEWHREGDTWQPIETAPKNDKEFGGDEVDLWAWNHRITNCHWHKGAWLHWNSDSVDEEPRWVEVEDPTHWMPLPKPPAVLAAIAKVGGST